MKLQLKAIQVVDIQSEYAAVVSISSGLYVMFTFQEENRKTLTIFHLLSPKGSLTMIMADYQSRSSLCLPLMIIVIQPAYQPIPIR